VIAGNRVLCVIPARGGSKGVPRKNMRLLAGRPLIAYTFDDAIACPDIDRTIVSTDSEEIAAFARSEGMDVPFLRPAELATDEAGTIDVLLHAMDYVEDEEGQPYDIVALLHATAPLRLPDDVRACLRLVAEEHAQGAFAVSAAHGNPYFNLVEIAEDGRVRLSKEGGSFTSRQQTPHVYEICGAAYAWRWNVLRKYRTVVVPNCRVHVMPRARAIDIDDELDFHIAECLLENPTD
jgi:CMP-N,N'-diacetyllegionaminic acid synthase